MADAVLSPIESFFASLPGGNYPIGRAAWAGTTGGVIMYGVKPAFAFESNGEARPWILLDSSNPNATIFPAWMAIVLPGVIFGYFL